MDAAELARWTRFAAKGGIGKCTATKDCVAEGVEDLMFLQDDEIIVLMQLAQDGLYLGYCEGVVGRFHGVDVRFHSKLKKPVLTKRPTSTSSPTPSTSTMTPTTISPSPSLNRTPESGLRSLVNSPTPVQQQRVSMSPAPAPLPTDAPNTEPEFDPGSSEEILIPSTVSRASTASVIESTLPTPADASPTRETSRSSSPEEALPSVSLEQQPELEVTSREEEEKPVRVITPGPASDREDDPVRVETPEPPAPQAELPSLERGAVISDIIPIPPDPATPDERSPTTFRSSTSSRYSQPISAVPPSSTYGSMADRDSMIGDLNNRTSALSDGEFGIGLSLLQGLIGQGDRGSNRWSFDGTDDTHESPHTTRATTPPQTARPTPTGDTPTRTEIRNSHASSAQLSSRHSESDMGDWDGGEDIYDDYRYSRFSLASKMSKQSRMSGSGLARPPPLPGDPPLPTSRSTRSRTSSEATSQYSVDTSAFDDSSRPGSHGPRGPPPPLNLPNREPLSPTSPLSPTGSGSRSPGIASALRQRIENDRALSPNPSSPNPSLQPPPSPNPTLLPPPSPSSLLPPPSPGRASPSPSLQPPSPLSPSRPLEESAPTKVETEDPPPPSPSIGLPDVTCSPKLLAPPSPVVSNSAEGGGPPTANASEARRGPANLTIQPTPFLPHPGAPAPNPHALGNPPMSPRPPTHSASPPGMTSSMSLLSTLALAATRARGLPKTTTIHGRMQTDLLSASGPVPISFSLEGQPNEAPKPATPTPQPATGSLAKPIGLGIAEKGSNEEKRLQEITDKSSESSALPRANFFPKVGTARPRSRSFSGFSGTVTEVPLPIERSREEGSSPLNSFSSPNARSTTTRSQSARPTVTPPRSISPQSTPIAGRTGKAVHVPSPLSLPSNVVANPSISTPQSLPSSPQPPATTEAKSKSRGLRHIASTAMMKVGLGGSSSSHSAPPVPPPAPTPVQRQPEQVPPPAPVTQPLPPPLQPPVLTRRTSGSVSSTPPPEKPEPSPTRRSINTPETDPSDRDAWSERIATPPLVGGNNSSASSSPLVRNTSLRSKLSMSALKAKSASKGIRDESPGPSVPTTPSGQQEFETKQDEETVQVQDMEFELIKPVMNRVSSIRVSEDGRAPSDGLSIRSGVDGESWRSESPAMSPGGSLGAGSANSFPRSDTSAPPKPSRLVQTASMEAHRSRELRWISAMSTIPSKEARKNKKIKKLVTEGIPASVRGLVWAHLADSKARRVPGIYAQFGKRPRLPAADDIERDAKACFPEQTHLHEANGPLLSLLQAYLGMVPDVLYRRGLTVIAGQLLLQAPEEDAFWLFVATMDSHLRGYFATYPAQMEADSSLFRSALEAVDSALAKKIFADFGVRPIDFCGPWFSTIFASALPQDHLHRVWDYFLYEGIPFLFRVGLAIMSLCRRHLLEAPPGPPTSVVPYIIRPPPEVFPADADALISQAFAIKLKEDDLRKQRPKLEAQLRLQHQPRPGTGGSTGK